MRFFLQEECHEPFFPRLFLTLQDEFDWKTTFPDGRWSGLRCVHLLTRGAPADAGRASCR